ncbi:MAG: DNA-processing protein DprA [Thermoguttaceae bacterium]|nr:DNA-processing protein DprA [Thermoguttaceae bacterium]
MKRGRSPFFDDDDSLDSALSWNETNDDAEDERSEKDAEPEIGALNGRCDFTLLAKDDKSSVGGDSEKLGDSGACEESEELGESRPTREPVVSMKSNDLSDFNEGGEAEESAEDAPSGEASRIWAPEELVDDILLSTVDGVGPLTTERLIAYFGSAGEVLRASRRDLERVEKVGPTISRKISQAREACDVDALLRFCRENGIEIVASRDARYPERLREIDNPPRLLYVRGAFAPEDRAAIAIVGTRGATRYGLETAERLGRELAEAGFTVVSGLALGIDGAAHRGALDVGGRTLAALGGGVAKIYPREHEGLARRVAESGAVFSEYHPLTSPLAGNFPARNRIVAGLSLGVLVVESPLRSGSLITARLAAEQNREVFAVPGPVDRETSRGCHRLLREGAALVESVEDVLEALPTFELPKNRTEGKKRRENGVSGEKTSLRTQSSTAISDFERASRERRAAALGRAPEKSRTTENFNGGSRSETAKQAPPASASTAIPEGLSDDERKIVELVGVDPVPIDRVVRESGLGAAKIVGLIAALEFKKILRRREGNAVSRR